MFDQLDRDREQKNRIRTLASKEIDLFALDKPSCRVNDGSVGGGRQELTLQVLSYYMWLKLFQLG